MKNVFRLTSLSLLLATSIALPMNRVLSRAATMAVKTTKYSLLTGGSILMLGWGTLHMLDSYEKRKEQSFEKFQYGVTASPA